MRFRSKVDGGVHFAVGASVCVALLALLFGPPLASGTLRIAITVTVLGAGLVGWTTLSTYYELERDALVAHCGPFRWRMPYAAICAVHESRSIRSAPALSLDRLEVEDARGRVLVISPADKAGFIAALKRHVPTL